MRLEFLKRFVRIEKRIVVFERDDHAERDAIVAQAVDPAAAVNIGGERPAERVRNVARVDAAGLHVPQFLDAEAVDLRVQAVEFQFADEIFGERAARAFGEHGDFGAQFVAGREVIFRLAVLVDAFVFGEDAGDAVFFVEQFATGKLREEIDAFFFDEAAEPFHELVERDDVVAVILQRRRRDGELVRIAFGEVVSGVAGDGSVERRGFFEVGDEFAEGARVHDGAGELMGADFAGLFEDVDIFRGERGRFLCGVVLVDQIGKVQRAGKAARAGADDENVCVEAFTLCGHWFILTEAEIGEGKMVIVRELMNAERDDLEGI